MDLSVAMIVKNEEKFLRRCLDSIAPVTTELSIVDTGSTDNTVEVIKGFEKDVDFPVILNYHKWEDGFFAGNRNYSLKFCTKDWILWIDADERLYKESYNELKELINKPNIYTIICSLLSDLPDGRVSKHFLPKIFRGGTAHFKEIVHNQLIHASPAIVSGIKIHHYGYALDAESMKKKRKRTSDLLRIQIKEKEDNPFACMNLSRTLMNDQNYEQSIKVAMKGLEYSSSLPCQQMLYYSVAMCYVNLQKFEEAEEACWQALKLNSENLDMIFVLAIISIKQKRWEKCILYLNRYIQLKEIEEEKPDNQRINFLIVDFYEARDKAYNMMGFCYSNLGEKQKAVMMLREAVRLNPNISFLKNLAVAYDVNGDVMGSDNIYYQLAEMGYVDEESLARFRG